MISKGTRVGWTLKNGETGSGMTVADEDAGHVLVAVDPVDPATVQGWPPWVKPADYEFHRVIWCTATWLTVIP